MFFQKLLLVSSIVVVATATTDDAQNLQPSLSKQKDDKLSDESVMFGNQQNKPSAGMVDDALAKSIHDEAESYEKERDNALFHEEEKRSPSIISEGGVESSEEETDTPNIPLQFGMYENKMAQYMENAADDEFAREQLHKMSDDDDLWGDSERRDNYRRFRRNARNHQRNIRTSLEELLEKRNARIKRGLNAFAEDDDDDDENDDLRQTIRSYRRPMGLQDDEENTWDDDDDNSFNDNPDTRRFMGPNQKAVLDNLPRDWYEMMMDGQMPEMEHERGPEQDLEYRFRPGMDILQHGFQPPYDYRTMDEDANPDLSNDQGHFFKRRLQESEEEEENLDSDDDDEFMPMDEEKAMLNGRNIDDIYRRLIW